LRRAGSGRGGGRRGACGRTTGAGGWAGRRRGPGRKMGGGGPGGGLDGLSAAIPCHRLHVTSPVFFLLLAPFCCAGSSPQPAALLSPSSLPWLASSPPAHARLSRKNPGTARQSQKKIAQSMRAFFSLDSTTSLSQPLSRTSAQPHDLSYLN
jgi:hypothetical protein